MAVIPSHPLLLTRHQRAPEWRKHPYTGQWVVIAPQRAARPMLTATERKPLAPNAKCPFCNGFEGETPPEIFAVRPPDTSENGPGWRIRVVPNRYAAVQTHGDTTPVMAGVYQQFDGVGLHELFIECPHHESKFANLSEDAIYLTLHAWRERLKACRRRSDIRSVQIFKNQGEEAGASVPHCHSQLIALPMLPAQNQAEAQACLFHFQRRGRTLTGDLIRHELEINDRIVIEGKGVVAMTAYAGRQPFESWLMSQRGNAHFDAVEDEELHQVSKILKRFLQAMDKALSDPPLNLILRTAPFNDPDADATMHWRIEVLPRLTHMAGFEWGTGSYINPVLPEDAAVILREAVDGG